jgi:hypothetical protein
MEVTGHTQFEIRSLEESGDYTLACLQASFMGQRSGVPLTGGFVLACWAGGRITEFRNYFDGDRARRAYERLRTRPSTPAAAEP